ncbi:CinA family protein [Caminibacter mediatlanticus TB-2]|uniref:CinA family protein n=1 Tax=Caminibacter mediatlanticus TB-2 TaxID=391592 RepID=A0AAI9AF95_9BACT|nr:CinA family protein [Caminibacter mediatlanticus]EDM23081.1 CinA-like protein [Caminibacter mediatlanticus TB-2]QCT94527.1 CinA family protein [Caminibacter mediatlanticus TB-2]
MQVIFVGKEWKFKKELQEDILKLIDYNKIVYLNNFDIEFLPKEDSLIVTNKKTYPLVARIIARLTNQNLIVKNDFLVPEMAKFSKNSFLVKINQKNINVILVEDEIPEIFIITPEYECINVFRFDKETTLMFLEPILNAHKLDFTLLENEGGFLQFFTEPLDEKIKKEITKAIPYVIFGNIFEHIIKTLPPKKITFAESCTGGLIASSLTKHSGSSNCFDGSVVSYANWIKEEWLGVSHATLEKYGAVSEQTVKEMLLGAIEIAKSDYAIAVSGIAGPSGSTPEKPVGTVYIGVCDRKNLKVELYHFKGSRNYIQYQAMMNGIRMFINFAELYYKGD